LAASKKTMTPASPSLIEVLRSTLQRLEQHEDLASDDPALAELKGSILRTIAELEVTKAPLSTAPLSPAKHQQRILWIAPRVRPAEIKPASDGAPPGEDSAVKQPTPPSAKASRRKPRTRTPATRTAK
jgi:hypothetical protein